MANTKDKLKEVGFKLEKAERGREIFVETGYPKPKIAYRLTYETYGLSLEEIYFWILNCLKIDTDHTNIIKISDVFSSAEQSSFWGQQKQRLKLQEETVMNYMASIGKLLKELFQIVRDIRITSERLELYESSAKGDVSAENTLKNFWVTLVEGGTQNPNSVYGLANQVGFRTLPDMFFSMNIINSDFVDKEIEKLDVNRKLKEILGRKLKAYLLWKEHTWKEVKHRKMFALRYLRQHYNVIKMYMEWVKPYLKAVRRLRGRESHLEKPELIGAFENAIIEIEVLANKSFGKADSTGKDTQPHSCILFSVEFQVQPLMQYQQEGYHKGPLHVGRAEINLRGYVWSKKQIEDYVRIKREETLELMGEIDESIKESIDALGEELNLYLKEAEQGRLKESIKELQGDKKKIKSEASSPSMFDPFVSVFKGVGDLGKAFAGTPSKKTEKKPSKREIRQQQIAIKDAEKKAKKDLTVSMWITYKNFKKSHQMIAW